MMGFIGAKEKELFLSIARILKIETIFIDVDDSIRANYKIINDQDGRCTEFNQAGFTIPENMEKQFLSTFSKLINRFDFVSLSGSIPPGISPTIYSDLIKIARMNNVFCALDTSSGALCDGIKSIPHLLRINLGELEELNNRKIKSTQQIINAIEELHETGIELVVISRGEMGAIASDNREIWSAIPPKIKSVNPIGAGDAMMAGCLLQKSKESDLQEIIKFSTAFATTSIGFDNLQTTNFQLFDENLNKTKLIKIR